MTFRVAYLVDETLKHPVLQSQSLAVIARLGAAGLEVDLLVANSEGPVVEAEIARRFLGESVRIVFLARRYRGTSTLAKARRAMARALARRRAGRFLAAAASAGQPVVIHARGSAMHLGAHLRAEFENTRLVADVRGDGAAEARFNHPGPTGEHRAATVDRMDAAVFARADHVIGVSAALLGEIRKRFDLRCDATVIPCLADERVFFHDAERRAEARRALGVASSPLVAYAGSIGQWHQFDATLETFEAIARGHREARFLIATRDSDKAMGAVAARPDLSGRTMVRHGEAAEVSQWLSAADVGLLLREAHPLNHVACPTKFAEYVLSGLRVVVSEGIGDLPGWVRDLDLGRCVPGAHPTLAAAAALELIARPGSMEDREARVRRAQPVLSMGARLGDWQGAYAAALDPRRPKGE